MVVSRNFLRQAREELAKEDLLQASNKAWGAAAYAIKAAAEKRRWFNDADWRLQEAASVITAEQDDKDIMLGFLAARQAHFHFYHHEHHAYTYRQIIDATEVMLNKVEALLARDAPPPYVSEQVSEIVSRLKRPTSTMDRERLASGRKPMSERPPALPPEASENLD